ncbi:hypothetical protein [Paracoccus sulfuroxidans]|uniref:Uncharacterized protein n=1 Tax=Paracoccus sulfuroxidans TaxID=384678 RepID=A0A562N7Q1_9RHOB|nr:hypothetical protein [Paracoccus sulfuroxidans]TWI28209.1 hypothetical protein IQ24_03826 [Paracoccus sulfuroxidans]
MRTLNSKQRQELDLYCLGREESERLAMEKAKAAADEAAQQEAAERAEEVRAWEETGLSWLKDGEALFGPNYDFQDELRRLGMRYAVDRILPYEDLNDLGVNVYAGASAIFIHGAVALFLSWIAIVFGVPNWIGLLVGSAYVFWRFRIRKVWLLKQRAEARAFRKEVVEAQVLREGML